MQQHNIKELPDPQLLVDVIAVRDFSQYDEVEGDTDDVKEEKKEGRDHAEQVMDMFNECLVTGIANPKLWSPEIRHFEPMTTSKMPAAAGEDQLRIPASTEAMAILTYENNKSKWQAMAKWRQDFPRAAFPTYSSKNPDSLVEFKEEYSSCQGQTDKWGGWNAQGRKRYVELQKMIHQSRIDNRDRHIKHDNECVARLFTKYKAMHKNSMPDPKKAKTTHQVDRSDDADFDFMVEL